MMNWNWNLTVEAITAIGATIGIFLMIKDRFVFYRISLRVATAQRPTLSDGMGGFTNEEIPILTAEIKNTGRIEFHISDLYLLINRKHILHVYPAKFYENQAVGPVSIPSGRRKLAEFDYREILKKLPEHVHKSFCLRVVFEREVGRSLKSRPLRLSRRNPQ